MDKDVKGAEEYEVTSGVTVKVMMELLRKKTPGVFETKVTFSLQCKAMGNTRSDAQWDRACSRKVINNRDQRRG